MITARITILLLTAIKISNINNRMKRVLIPRKLMKTRLEVEMGTEIDIQNNMQNVVFIAL